MANQFHFTTVAASLVLLAGAGCRKPVPHGALVLTQSPATATANSAVDIMDSRYPSGSRVVLAKSPIDLNRVQVLSKDLFAAGDPTISYDGQRVFFAGKAKAASDWQVYEASLDNGRPSVLTSMPGGAMNPALLPDGSLIFVSPVSKIGVTNSKQPQSALYVQSPGGRPRQLTFSSQGISEPTMLADGRILFVSTVPQPSSNSTSGPALFTINNDGTEITAFAEQQDQSVQIERSRELLDGRIGFVVSKRDASLPGGVAEVVRKARPFQSRAPLFPGVTTRVCAVQPASNGDLLVCAENSSGTRSSLALYRVNPTATDLGTPLMADPSWNSCEAVEVAPHRRPMGRLSTMDVAKQTGKLLCLDANFSNINSGGSTSPATHVRLLAEASPGVVRALGEVPVQADGSFQVEVPADVPLGFEALDESGQVLRREAPMIWVRPGENRSCIGCHEPHNQSPRNHRPLAVSVPVPRLNLQGKSN